MSYPEIHRRNKRRMFLTLLLFVAIWTGLLGRLLWIQVVDVHRFSKHRVNLVEEAVAQRKQELILHTGRGDIKDRHGIPLTGSEIVGVAIFPLVRGQLEEEKIRQLARLIHYPEARLLELIRTVKEPTFLRDEQGKMIELSERAAHDVDRLALPGVLALPVTERYQPDGIASQLIGYISQNPELIEKEYAEELKDGQITRKTLIGASGLERSFERFLQGVGPTSVSYFVDGRGNPLNGIKARLIQQDNQFYPLSLLTTIDKDLQTKAEKWMKEQNIERGSAVVLDAKTREVLAMVSLPDFKPAQIKPADDSWVNRALKQTFPGSVFKTVVAAAVLEEGLVHPDEKFVCEGKYGKYGFSCWKEGGHGEISFTEAYAESCNIAFAKAVLRLPKGKLEEYARKLGLDQRVGWQQAPFFKMDSFQQFSGEDKGQVFAKGTPDDDEGVLIQTAIGQRDVQMTPLQAANMVATILEGGRKKEVRVVQEIKYKTGTTFYSFPEHDVSGETIDRYTAYQLRKLMEAVVEEGTGAALQGAAWKLAGKTGTAQTNAAGKNNQWFVGYGPADAPQYVVAIVAEQVDRNEPNKVLPVFKRLMDELAGTKDSDE